MQAFESVELRGRRLFQPRRQCGLRAHRLAHQIDMGPRPPPRCAGRSRELLRQLLGQQQTAQVHIADFTEYRGSAPDPSVHAHITLEQPLEREQQRVAVDGGIADGQSLPGHRCAHRTTVLTIDVLPHQ